MDFFIPIRCSHGNKLIDGIRLFALACVTHDGLGDELYSLAHRAILHAAGQIAFPMLFALRQLGLLSGRTEFDPASSTLDSTSSASGNGGVTNPGRPTSAVSLSNAVARLQLGQRRKSRYK